MTLPRLLILLSLSGAALVGCADATGGPAGTDASIGKSNDFDPAPIPAAVWGACWFEADGSMENLVCELTEATPLSPAVLMATVSNESGFEFETGFSSGWSGISTIATVRSDSFPVRLDLSAGFEPSDRSVNGWVVRSLTLATEGLMADGHRADNPIDLVQPFGIWPIQVACIVDGASFEERSGEEDIAPWYDGRAGETLDDFDTEMLTSFFLSAGEVATFFTPAPGPEGAAIEGELVIVDGSATTFATAISGPGQYVVDADGLRSATDADASLFE